MKFNKYLIEISKTLSKKDGLKLELLLAFEGDIAEELLRDYDDATVRTPNSSVYIQVAHCESLS